MRKLLSLAVAMLVYPTVSYAQLERGNIEISGVTAFSLNKQTLGSAEGDGSSDLNLTTMSMAGEIAFYLSPRVGVGAMVSHIGFKLEAPDGTSVLSLNGGFYGGILKLRFPAGERANFVLLGSGGLTRAVIEGGGDPIENSGFYFMAGGSINFAIGENASLDIGARYQSSTFNTSTEGAVGTTASGLLMGLGFSIYIR